MHYEHVYCIQIYTQSRFQIPEPPSALSWHLWTAIARTSEGDILVHHQQHARLFCPFIKKNFPIACVDDLEQWPSTTMDRKAFDAKGEKLLSDMLKPRSGRRILMCDQIPVAEICNDESDVK
jgi:hypothetical protein